MKKLLGKVTALALVALMAFSVLSITKVNAASYNGEVTFVIDGQEKKVNITSGDEKIGGTDNRGVAWDKTEMILGIIPNKQYFMGWSTDKNYSTKNNAKMFYTTQTFKEILPEGIKPDVKIYPVYFAQTSALVYFGSKNTININHNKTATETILNGEVLKDTFKTAKKGENKKAEVYYDKSIDKYNLKFDSTFEINKNLAHWLYLGNGHTIMTNTQSNLDSVAKDARYTHVDLNVEIPEGIDVPEKLTLSFESLYFQPHMVIDGNNNKLDVEGADPAQKWNIKPLVTAAPKTTFTVLNSTKSQKITVRTILRTNGGTRVPDLKAQDVEDALMRLNAETPLTISNEKAKEALKQGKSFVVNGDIDGYAVLPASFSQKIPTSKAENPIEIKFVANKVKFDRNTAQFGDTDPQEIAELKVVHNGTIKDNEAADAVFDDRMLDPLPDFKKDDKTYKFKGWSTTPNGDVNFTKETKVTKDITVYAVWEKQVFNVTYKFESISNQPLPNVVTDLLPAPEVYDVDGTVANATDPAKTEVTVEGGKWVFKGWDQTSKPINGADIEFVGKWEYVSNPVVNPIPNPKPEQPKQPEPKKEAPKAPKTGDDANYIYGLSGMFIALIGAIYFSIKLRKE